VKSDQETYPQIEVSGTNRTTSICTVDCANLVVWSESVAQLVEHRPFKALVLGSSPSALTITLNIFNSLDGHRRIGCMSSFPGEIQK
jgi:hypothetical protein